LAKYVIEHSDENLRVGLLRDKQTLKPIVSIVLVKQVGSELLFLTSKRRYLENMDILDLMTYSVILVSSNISPICFMRFTKSLVSLMLLPVDKSQQQHVLE